MPSAMMRFCKDCRRCSMGMEWTCTSPEALALEIAASVEYRVTGILMTQPPKCIDARGTGSFCGPQAKFFEPKEGE